VQTRTEQVGGELVLSLEGEVGIAEAGRLRDELLGSFDRAEQITVDLSQLQDMDTAAMQLLYAAHHTAGKRRKAFAVRNTPEAVSRSLGLLGLTDAAPFSRGGDEVRS